MEKKRPLEYSFKEEVYSDEKSLESFLEFVQSKKITLYDAQEEAILELFDGNNVLLNTPTGSGKSLVATALHYNSLTQRRRSIYTSPVKALVNEKFFNLCNDFGPLNVGMMTGDAAVNRDAPILCCTAEILANMALRKGEHLYYHDIVIDEFHYYTDRERGTAWQIPLLTLKNSRFLLMTATFGDVQFFEKELTKLNKLPTKHIFSENRPVPLNFTYNEDSLDHTVSDLVNANKAPLYIVNFSQREASQVAQNLTSINVCSKEQKKEISNMLATYDFSSPFGKELKNLLKNGIGVHHAGLLPKYRILVENLAQKGLLKIISGTDTLGVGVNIPIRTVILTKLCKFDGQKTVLLKARDFHQISGRAGRKGFDDNGYIVCQAPAHVIENKKLERKALLNPRKKFNKTKPPTKGYIPWNQKTFDDLTKASSEHLRSVFKIDHGILLNVLSRPNDGCNAAKKLIKNSHESQASKVRLRKRTFQLFKALIKKKLVEIVPIIERIDKNKIRININLQDDFSLNQSLSLFLIETLPQLDPFDGNYALNLLSIVESIIENPKIILNRQLDKVKRDKISDLKQEGVDYFDRLNLIEDLEYPKPLAEFIYSNFNKYKENHPWVGNENISPKSIVREMYENFMNFSEYIKEYKLEKAEGVLLRYISSAYQTLTQTVPEVLRNDEIDEMIDFLRATLKETDSSLIQEWKKLQHLEVKEVKKTENQKIPTFTKKQLTIIARNACFNLLRALGRGEYSYCNKLIKNTEDWSEKRLEETMTAYYKDHHSIDLGIKGRSPKNTIISDISNPMSIQVEMIIVDTEELNDWSLNLIVCITGSSEDPNIEITMESLAPIGGHV